MNIDLYRHFYQQSQKKTKSISTNTSCQFSALAEISSSVEFDEKFLKVEGVLWESNYIVNRIMCLKDSGFIHKNPAIFYPENPF